VSSVDEAEHVYVNMLNKGDAVVKAQVLSGGRGLGTFKNGFKGGVHLATTLGDVKKFTESMLGQHLVTKQSGPAGIVCNKVLLVERLYMRREMYLSIMMDRTTQGPMIVASPVGGTSIEDVAASNPEKIFTEPIDIMEGLSEEAAAGIATKIGATGVMLRLFGLFPGSCFIHSCLSLVDALPKTSTLIKLK